MPKFVASKPELDATKVPSAIDIAWAAGVYEGEGHVRNRKSNSTIISVTQKGTEILYRLRDWFGGSVRLASCTTAPPESYCHCWIVCGDRARLFIALAYPFMSSRRKSQVDATGALEFLGSVSPDGLSYQQIKSALEERAARYISSDPYRVRKTALNRERRRKLAAMNIKSNEYVATERVN